MAEPVAFASPEQLAARLGRAVWPIGLELDRVQELLLDASAHLRGIIGWQVYPPATVAFRMQRTGQRVVPLPGEPVTSITSVTSAGTDLPAASYELVDGAVEFLHSYPSAPLIVNYTVGYPAAPRELASWTCVLASQALSALEELGALGGGGVSSVAIDDFRKSWADGGDGAGFALPARVEEKLRERYGAGGAFVTGAR